MRITRYSLLLLLMGAPVLQALAEKPTVPAEIEGARTLSAEEVVEHLLGDPSLVIIDARKEKEYAKGHIERAVSLTDTRMTPEVLARYVTNKGSPVLFYCDGPHCLRSSHAVAKAHNWGYRQLYWFRGGWHEWTVKKLPIER